jgi:acetylornithine aminotransferase
MLGTTFGGNHLACAAALGVLEVIESDRLMDSAETVGNHLVKELKTIESITNVRGEGLMIGFDLPAELKTLRKVLLDNYKIFTGEAKPNVVRLLPSLALTKAQADEFLQALRLAIDGIKSEVIDTKQAISKTST